MSTRQPSDASREIILEIGAEGGSFTVVGQRMPDGWTFAVHLKDSGPVLVGDGRVHVQRNAIDTLDAALTVLDRYPWYALFPLQVHPEFFERIVAAAKERHAKRPGARPFDERRWQHALRAHGTHTGR